MSLLSIVQDAAREIGLDVPQAAFASTDQMVAQMVRLANKDGIDLARRYDWQGISAERTFVSLADEIQTGILPADFSRFIDRTFFNRSRKRAFAGPLTPVEWQEQKGLTSTVVVDAFRVRGNALLVMPAPPAGDIFAFEYVSKYWVDTDGDGDGEAQKFGADGHVSLIDEELITLGIIWRFKMARGFDYAEDFRSYEARFARLAGDDGGKRDMDLTRGSLRHRPLAPQAPEGSWGV